MPMPEYRPFGPLPKRTSGFFDPPTEPVESTTDALLRELIEQIKGLRADMKAAEWRNGTAALRRRGYATY
jgi:hypothetical protein